MSLFAQGILLFPIPQKKQARMTSVAVMYAVDSRKGSGLYVLSDSRFTWGTSAQRWDGAQKTFASRTSPDIFGFCGDAFFPPTILRSLIDLADSGCVFAEGDDADQRHLKIADLFKSAISREVNALQQDFYVFHGARDGEAMQSTFRLWVLAYSWKTKKWDDKEWPLQKTESYLALSGGTGAPTIRSIHSSWDGTSAKGTNRTAAWSFFEALESGKDPNSGGAPQMTGLWRIGCGRTFGFQWEGRRYVGGTEFPPNGDTTRFDWFNNLFERIDGQTGELLKGAARQPKPARP